MTLSELRAVCEKATPGEWEAFDNYVMCETAKGERGKMVAECFANNPMWGDNSNDTRHIATFHPARVMQLLEDYEAMKAALERYAEGNALQVKPEKEYLYADPADKVLWLQRSMSDHDDKRTARECLASLRLGKEGGENE